MIASTVAEEASANGDVYENLKQFATHLVELFEEKLKEYKKEARVGGQPKKGKSLTLGAKLCKLTPASKVTDVFFDLIFDPVRRAKVKSFTQSHKGIDKSVLRRITVGAAAELFRSFEWQFMHIAKYDVRGMDKLAKDAVDRIIDHINALSNQNEANEISSILLAKAAVFGKSKSYVFGGYAINNEQRWRTSLLYSKVGLCNIKADKFYSNGQCEPNKYGYRQLFEGEAINLSEFQEDLNPCKTDYNYFLESEILAGYVENILAKINRKDPEDRSERVEKDVAEIVAGVSDLKTKVEENIKCTIDLKQALKNVCTTSLSTRGRRDEDKVRLIFNVGRISRSFTGRESQLLRMREELQNEKKCVTLCQAASISGLGGIGKSELARKYAYEYFCNDNSNALWIDAETSSSIKNSFYEASKIVNKNNIDVDRDRDVKDIAREIYEMIPDKNSLIIFDNAEDYKAIEDVMPWSLVPGKKSPEVLITSRNQNWDIGQKGDIKIIELQEFTPDEAMKFVKTALSIDAECQDFDKEIANLTKKLMYFPLALTQAVAYINERQQVLKKRNRKFTITDYVKSYESEEKLMELLRFQPKHDIYTKTLYTTWKVTLRNIEVRDHVGGRAVELIKIMSYLSPDNIEIENLFLRPDEDEEEFWEAVDLLWQYSILKLENGLGSVHRLVQTVVRLWLQEQNEEENVLRDALNLNLNAFCIASLFHEDWNHVMSIWKYASKYDLLIDDHFFKYSTKFRFVVMYLLGEQNLVQSIESLLKRCHEKNISTDDFEKFALSGAVLNGCVEVTEFLSPNDARYKIAAMIAASPKYGIDDELRTQIHSLISKPENMRILNNPIEVIVIDCIGFDCLEIRKNTILHTASFHGSSPIVQLLLEYGTEYNVYDSFKSTPLYIASERGYYDIVRMLLDIGANDEEMYKACGKSSLYAAVENGRYDIIELLLNHDADVDSYNWDNGKNPLFLAAQSGNLDVVKLLVEYGADIDNTTPFGYSAFDIALNSKEFEIARFLLQNGCDTAISDVSYDAFIPAAAHGYADLVEIFLKQNFDVEFCDDTGKSALKYASQNGHLDVVEVLLKYGARNENVGQCKETS